MTDYLESLDPEQRRAATAMETRVRCLAGAGSGKSRALVARVGWLIDHEGVSPTDILVLTFSKRAADELVHRLGAAKVASMQVGTFHSLGLKIVRSAVPGAKVADEALSRRLIRKAYAETKPHLSLAKVLTGIGRMKVRGEEPATQTALRAVWDRYHALLKEGRLYDFNDMILVPTTLIDQGNVRACEWVGRWQHVCVDEGQDTSWPQYALLEALVPGTSENTTLFVVGDRSQGIYGWRGAEPDMMLDQMDEMFGPFTTYGMPRNYRSGHRVVGLANRLMDGQRGALSLVAQRELPADVTVLRGENAHDEARQIVEEMHEAHECGGHWREMAVLFRTNAQAEAFEAACGKGGVPYTVVGGVGFYDRSEVLDVLAYVKLSQGWDYEALDRIYNRPSRYLGHVWKAELEAQGGWERFRTGEQFAGLGWSRTYMSERTLDLRRAVLRLQAKAEDDRGPAEIVEWVLGDVGYRAWLLGEEPDDADEVKGEMLDAVLDAARGFKTVAEFLAFAEECRRRGKPAEKEAIRDRVSLSTVHRAKGLEWPLVAVAGFAEGLLPHRMCQGDDAEERRVAYVALTRARDHLILGYYGEPSRYLRELVEAGLVTLPGTETAADRESYNPATGSVRS